MLQKQGFHRFVTAAWLVSFIAVLALWGSGTGQPVAAQQQTVRFAVIGDLAQVVRRPEPSHDLVKSWNPDFVITTGDNNYPDGAASTIDKNIGQFYHDFIYPYTGSYGAGATTNRFFPSLGNHDWHAAGAQPYLNYFVLPGNERYYDFTWGPVQFFAIDSDPHELDGISSTSTQAVWLRGKLAASTSRWKIVYDHHPPFSSSSIHGSTLALQWPYQAWGATAVLSGHDHTYERIVINGFPYIVNGAGGASLYAFGTPVSGSVIRYNAANGAMLVEASDTQITFRFYSAGGRQHPDRYLYHDCQPTADQHAYVLADADLHAVITPTPTHTPTPSFTPTPTVVIVPPGGCYPMPDYPEIVICLSG